MAELNLDFSIITVCYNAKDDIGPSISSVISQTYGNREYIIVDGQSKDGTIEIINDFRNDISLIISEPDKGIYDAMNKGAKLASGDYLIFMNAGDIFVDENVLANVANALEKGTDVLYGDNILMYKTEKLYHKAKFFSKDDINLPFNHQSVFVRTQLAKDYPFDLRYKIAGDYYFFYTLYRLGKKFQYIPIPIANYNMDGMSQDNVIRTFKEVRMIQGTNQGLKYRLDLMKLNFKLFIRNVAPENIVNFYRRLRN